MNEVFRILSYTVGPSPTRQWGPTVLTVHFVLDAPPRTIEGSLTVDLTSTQDDPDEHRELIDALVTQLATAADSPIQRLLRRHVKLP